MLTASPVSASAVNNPATSVRQSLSTSVNRTRLSLKQDFTPSNETTAAQLLGFAQESTPANVSVAWSNNTPFSLVEASTEASGYIQGILVFTTEEASTAMVISLTIEPLENEAADLEDEVVSLEDEALVSSQDEAEEQDETEDYEGEEESEEEESEEEESEEH